MTPIEPALLSEAEARRYLGGLSRPTLSRIRSRGEITEVKIGRRLFFQPADLDAFVERHIKPASVEPKSEEDA